MRLARIRDSDVEAHVPLLLIVIIHQVIERPIHLNEPVSLSENFDAVQMVGGLLKGAFDAEWR